jgi:hypothetical protein
MQASKTVRLLRNASLTDRTDRRTLRNTGVHHANTYSSDKGHSPTLGQLLFVAKFWNDPLMDQCTNLFTNIRNQTKLSSPNFTDQVARLAHVLEQPLTPNGIAMTIPDARNRSAHPREDEAIEWGVFIHSLKEMIGKPPAELLKLVVTLSVAGNTAQQGAALDGDSAAFHSRQ